MENKTAPSEDKTEQKPNPVMEARSKAQVRKEASYKEARRLADFLGEPEVGSVQRMVEIFGPVLVNQKAQEAQRLYEEACALGSQAYTEPNTAVATGKSRPRTPGGVFFYLMKNHCASLGLDWEGLRIASSLWFEERKIVRTRRVTSPSTGSISSQSGTKPAPKPETTENNQTEKLTDKGEVFSKSKVNSSSTSNVAEPAFPAPSVASASVSVSSTETKARASRLRATLVGTLAAPPRFNPNGKEGLIELTFKVEMSPGLPKGLPNLGESRIVVWCTQKQYNRVSSTQTLTPETRFLIEGEPAPAVGRDLSPFLRLICTRFTTLDLEQSKTGNVKEGNESKNGPK